MNSAYSLEINSFFPETKVDIFSAFAKASVDRPPFAEASPNSAAHAKIPADLSAEALAKEDASLPLFRKNIT